MRDLHNGKIPHYAKSQGSSASQNRVPIHPLTYDVLALAINEVFLVDTLRVVAHAELAKSGRNDVPIEKIYLIPPYWGLEKFGLTNQ